MTSTVFKLGDEVVGYAYCASFADFIPHTFPPEVALFPLVIADPPYGNIVSDGWDRTKEDDKWFSQWMFNWVRALEIVTEKDGAFYVWGGIGKPGFRPFYRFMADVENETNFKIANHITWSKKRGYGIQHNYLFTREECAYLHFGPDIKKPRLFNVPLLKEKRGYAGYSKKYPAKSIPIETHTAPGEWVLDPFAGSGTTALACINLGRKFVVFENDPTIYAMMVKRLRSGVARIRDRDNEEPEAWKERMPRG